MQKFDVFEGLAAPFDLLNVDTDMIVPKEYLKTVKRSGLGAGLFGNVRYGQDGSPIPDFVLNLPSYRHASILITGSNFGCGSSREHAPWALMDFGIRCVIAESFADIFEGNCFKSGLLPIRLDAEHVGVLTADAADTDRARITVDLRAREVRRANGGIIRFDIDPFRRQCLLEGLDDIEMTQAHEPAIRTFERTRRSSRSWL